MTCESLWMTTVETLVALAKSGLVNITSLLVLENWRRTAHFISSPCGDCRTTPTLPTCQLDNLSVRTTHGTAPQALSFVVSSTSKSANAQALLTTLGLYCTSNSLSSIAHKTNSSGFLQIFHCLPYRFVHLNHYYMRLKLWLKFMGSRDQCKGQLLHGGYLSSAPLSVLLVQ